MDLGTTYELYNKLSEDKFSFLYQGEFSDDVMLNMLQLNDTNIDDSKEMLAYKKKVSHLMVECVQNVSTHSDDPDVINQTNNRPKMFMVRNQGSTYYLSSANLIKNEKLESLQNKLRELSGFSKEELQNQYVKILSTPDGEDVEGLGLIEMIQTADNNFEFNFEFINYYLSVFHVLIKAWPKIGDLKAAVPVSNITMENSQALHNYMIEKKITMAYRGDFSEDSVLPIINLMEENLAKDKSKGRRKTVLYLLIEMLQNISRHALEVDAKKSGIFLIGNENSKFFLNTGNLISTSSVNKIEEILKNVNELDDEGLDEAYTLSLTTPNPIASAGAGLGMLDIAKFSKEDIVYGFKEINDEQSFFSMSISI